MKKDNFISLVLFLTLIFLIHDKNENFNQKDLTITDSKIVSKIIMSGQIW